MEHHHPIMSKLRELGDQTYRQTYRPIPRNATAEALEALVTTLNFIDIWLKLFDHDCEVRCGMSKKSIK